MMRLSPEPCERVGRGVMSHRFPEQEDYLGTYPIRLGALLVPTEY